MNRKRVVPFAPPDEDRGGLRQAHQSTEPGHWSYPYLPLRDLLRSRGRDQVWCLDITYDAYGRRVHVLDGGDGLVEPWRRFPL